MIVARRIAAAMLAAGFAFAMPSLAQVEPPRVTVHTADLDLATPAGAAQLHARIANAVKRACGEGDIRDLTAQGERSACRAVALDAARPQVETALAGARADRALAQNQTRSGLPGL